MRRREVWIAVTILAGSAAFSGCGSSDTTFGHGGSGGAATGPTTNVGTTSGMGPTTSSGSGSGGAPVQMGLSRVDTHSGTAVAGSADVAIAPDGTLYVSWVDTMNGSPDLFVARSTDGGKTFGAAVMLDDASIAPLVSMARHPYIIANDEKVAVVFNDQPGNIYLYASPTTSLAFGPPSMVGADLTTPFRDFPKALFLADGALAVAWHGYAATGARMYVSRESAGYVSEVASSGAPGLPCECCPLETMLTTAGDLLLAFRNNDADTREMWLSRAPSAGTFTQFGALSTSEGTMSTCPMQGPRLAEPTPGSLLAVWSVRGSTNTGSVFLSTSNDGGATWSGGASLAGFTADEPTIAAGAPGHLFVTGVNGNAKSAMIASTDGGLTWSAPTQLAAPDGDLGTPQAKGLGGRAAFAAVSKAGTVWLNRME